ncbi:hypothetical protein BLSTO_02694 [Blastocystis sp. subtype 1]
MLVGYAFHVIIQGVCFYWLLENLKSCSFGEAIEGYGGDVFIISCVISIFVPYSRKWLWVYIIIPLYFAYLGIKLVVNWALTPDPTPEEMEEMKSNRQKKRENRYHTKQQ